MKKLFICLLAICLIGCSKPAKPNEEGIQSTLYSLIPVIEGDLNVYQDDDSFLFMEVHNTSIDDYSKFVQECKNSGFNNDVEESKTSFNAFNKNAEMIRCIYFEEENYYSIEVTESKIHSKLEWQDTDLLPKPNCKEGKIDRFDEKAISVYFHMNLEEFDEYVDMCKAFGFETNSQVSDKYFYAYDKHNNNLYLRYIGMETVALDLVIE